MVSWATKWERNTLNLYTWFYEESSAEIWESYRILLIELFVGRDLGLDIQFA